LPNQTQSKRVGLSVPPDLNNILEDLSELQGIPKTKVITSLLIELQPQLSLYRDALKAAKEGQNPNRIFANMFANSLTELGDLFRSTNEND